MASLSAHLVAPRALHLSFASTISRGDLEGRAPECKLGHGQGWAKGRGFAVRASGDGVFQRGAQPSSSSGAKGVRPQVIAPSGIAAPVAEEDPAGVDLVVDPPPKPEPLPSAAQYLHVMPDSLQYEAGRLGGISERTKDLEGAALAPTAIDYLTRILTSKVYDVAIETPLEHAKKLSERLGVKMLLKREDMQPVSC
jgi:hypothetical protein